MLPINNIIKKARVMLKDDDPEHNSYKDDEFLIYVNSAIRYLRRSIIAINPMYLADVTEDFTLDEGETKHEMEGYISSIIACVSNGKPLSEINPFDIKDFDEHGEPKYYYTSNLNKIVNFFPVPTKEIKIKVVGVSAFNELTINDYSPFVDDMDDFIVEYVVIRAGMGDQFNMAQEMSVMQTIFNQVYELVAVKSTDVATVESY